MFCFVFHFNFTVCFCFCFFRENFLPDKTKWWSVNKNKKLEKKLEKSALNSSRYISLNYEILWFSNNKTAKSKSISKPPACLYKLFKFGQCLWMDVCWGWLHNFWMFFVVVVVVTFWQSNLSYISTIIIMFFFFKLLMIVIVFHFSTTTNEWKSFHPWNISFGCFFFFWFRCCWNSRSIDRSIDDIIIDRT